VDNRTKKLKVVHEEPVSLGELIHQQVPPPSSKLFTRSWRWLWGPCRYERNDGRRGHRSKTRTVASPQVFTRVDERGVAGAHLDDPQRRDAVRMADSALYVYYEAR